MNNNIIITFEDGTKKEYPKGIKVKDIIKNEKDKFPYEVILVCSKNKKINLDDELTKNTQLKVFDITSTIGNYVYEKGLTYLFEISVYEVLGEDTSLKVRYPIDKGIFFEINKKTTEKHLEKIKEVMQDKVKKDLPIEKIETTRIEAINYFKNIKRIDKVKALTYKTATYVPLYKLEKKYNYFLGDLPNSTGILKQFDLTQVDGGIVLRLPFIHDKGKVAKYTHHEQLFNNLKEYSKWGEILNIGDLGELNEAIIEKGSGEIINLSEILQNYKLISIAENIALNSKDIKMVLISGPSSSGKTTSAKKLSMYLRASGLNTHHLSLDDYFLNRDETPLGDNGKPDYESIRALDIKLFNSQISKLLKGEKVVTPTYDFIEGEKIFNRPLELKDKDIIVVEGLHALNEELTREIPKRNKFKIYVSPLSYLNIDDDNRISQTDLRLLRRMVRDYRTRGYSPSHTLAVWSDVRVGEEKYVFPYQDKADIIFNSFLAYELSAIKVYVEPLLYSVKQDDPNYITAIKLLKLLKFVVPVPSSDIPSTSIIREFIGEGYFEK